jgi:hypothetical protein
MPQPYEQWAGMKSNYSAEERLLNDVSYSLIDLIFMDYSYHCLILIYIPALSLFITINTNA